MEGVASGRNGPPYPSPRRPPVAQSFSKTGGYYGHHWETQSWEGNRQNIEILCSRKTVCNNNNNNNNKMALSTCNSLNVGYGGLKVCLGALGRPCCAW